MSTASRTTDFVASIGVGAHVDDVWSSYASSDVAGQMAYLGVRNMRVQAPYANLAAYLALGRAGIRFDLITVVAHQNPADLAAEMALIDRVAPYVVAVEG